MQEAEAGTARGARERSTCRAQVLAHPLAGVGRAFLDVTWCLAAHMHASGYIAQWLERLTADQQVPGSNPGVPSLALLHFWPENLGLR